ncbi:MAG: hypothetical protein ABDH32_07440 [Candidatus Caldarchaeales archaeon]
MEWKELGEEAEYVERIFKSKFGIKPDFIKNYMGESDSIGFKSHYWKPRKTDMPCSRCGSNKDIWCIHHLTGFIRSQIVIVSIITMSA